jgi:acyl-CoA reductase-like NAD-dependent aldehyde dehydrogenase
MSTERIIVDRSVADAPVEKLAERADALTSGSPFDEGTMVGPVVTEASSHHVSELIADAQSKGPRWPPVASEGAVHRPSVSSASREMRLYGEESFGPVVRVMTADGTDDAVRAWPTTPSTGYRRRCSVMTPTRPGGRRAIQSGIHVNGATVHTSPAPRSAGVKASGGRFGSARVAHEFTTTRWITVSEEPRHYPI